MRGDPLYSWAFDRRVQNDVVGVDLWLTPIDYVILRKLEWHRD